MFDQGQVKIKIKISTSDSKSVLNFNRESFEVQPGYELTYPFRANENENANVSITCDSTIFISAPIDRLGVLQIS